MNVYKNEFSQTDFHWIHVSPTMCWFCALTQVGFESSPRRLQMLFFLAKGSGTPACSEQAECPSAQNLESRWSPNRHRELFLCKLTNLYFGQDAHHCPCLSLPLPLKRDLSYTRALFHSAEAVISGVFLGVFQRRVGITS